MTNPTRHLLLGSALSAGSMFLPGQGSGALAGNLPSTESIADDATATALLEEVRRLAPVLHAAIREANETVCGTPAYRAAQRRADAFDAQFWELAERVWAQPVRSWDDVITRAEIARAYLWDFAPCPGYDEPLDKLLEAVLAMAGGQRSDPRL
jgi:hypothetical protein